MVQHGLCPMLKWALLGGTLYLRLTAEVFPSVASALPQISPLGVLRHLRKEQQLCVLGTKRARCRVLPWVPVAEQTGHSLCRLFGTGHFTTSKRPVQKLAGKPEVVKAVAVFSSVRLGVLRGACGLSGSLPCTMRSCLS